MRSGSTLWDEMCLRYQQGVDTVRYMQTTWNGLNGVIDPDRFNQVSMLLTIQEKESVLWRNSCILYFQSFSRRPLPAGVEKADHGLEYYEKLTFPMAPGIKPKW